MFQQQLKCMLGIQMSNDRWMEQPVDDIDETYSDSLYNMTWRPWLLIWYNHCIHNAKRNLPPCSSSCIHSPDIAVQIGTFPSEDPLIIADPPKMKATCKGTFLSSETGWCLRRNLGWDCPTKYTSTPSLRLDKTTLLWSEERAACPLIRY